MLCGRELRLQSGFALLASAKVTFGAGYQLVLLCLQRSHACLRRGVGGGRTFGNRRRRCGGARLQGGEFVRQPFALVAFLFKLTAQLIDLGASLLQLFALHRCGGRGGRDRRRRRFLLELRQFGFDLLTTPLLLRQLILDARQLLPCAVGRRLRVGQVATGLLKFGRGRTRCHGSRGWCGRCGGAGLQTFHRCLQLAFVNLQALQFALENLDLLVALRQAFAQQGILFFLPARDHLSVLDRRSDRRGSSG
ncbi:MAG TPA: hypothetical protein VMW17_07750 [Candidatus Binatia bacterium]|nr:hypothetical protein [Candidatus Binatia bacterium]